MNRTPTKGRVLALLNEREHTVPEIRDKLGISHACAYQAVRRIGRERLTRRVDDELSVWWGVKPKEGDE